MVQNLESVFLKFNSEPGVQISESIISKIRFEDSL
jgi:hypothetical protein